LTDATERAPSEVVVAPADNDEVCDRAGDRREKDLDSAAFFDHCIEGNSPFDKRLGPMIMESCCRPRPCSVVQLFNVGLITQVQESRCELERMHSGEVGIAAVARCPHRRIQGFGQTVDPDHDLTYQRFGREQIHDRHHHNGQRAHRGDLTRDAAHWQRRETTPTAPPEDDRVRAQVTRRFQDRDRGMALAKDGSEPSRWGVTVLTRRRHVDQHHFGSPLDREP